MPTNYDQYWSGSKIRKGYAGTGLLTKIKPQRVTFGMGIEKHDEHGRIITAEFEKFVLVNTYFPNSGMKFEYVEYRTAEWDPDFNDYLDYVRDTIKKPVILTGDLNIGFNELDIFERKWKKHPLEGYHPLEYDSLPNLLNRGYIDTFRSLYPEKREFSNFSYRAKNPRERNRGIRVDYFIISRNHIDLVKDSSIYKKFLGSDHVPISIQLDCSKLHFLV